MIVTLQQAYAMMVLAVVAGAMLYHGGLVLVMHAWAWAKRQRQLGRARAQLLGMVGVTCPACAQALWMHDPAMMRDGVAVAKCPSGHQAVPMWALEQHATATPRGRN